MRRQASLFLPVGLYDSPIHGVRIVEPALQAPPSAHASGPGERVDGARGFA
ncbi:MAG TPA: hypothetical protein VM695_08805 [Phycisphaerae bacterium]|nr:hypothetical protein [Phycisphaerae bacterium]